MSTCITIKVSSKLVGLCGKENGRFIFEQQIRHQLFDDIEKENSFIIIFPEHVKMISSSFVDGMFEELLKDIGLGDLEKRLSVESSIPNLKEKMIKIFIAM